MAIRLSALRTSRTLLPRNIISILMFLVLNIFTVLKICFLEILCNKYLGLKIAYEYLCHLNMVTEPFS
jgi:hypothetical protein